jgi:hypothetical protein
MPYVVELMLTEGNFIEQMNRMRSWLDHRRVEPSAFRVLDGDDARECRVHFASEADAIAFAEEFGGELTAVGGITSGVAELNLRSASSSGSGRFRPR